MVQQRWVLEHCESVPFSDGAIGTRGGAVRSGSRSRCARSDSRLRALLRPFGDGFDAFQCRAHVAQIGLRARLLGEPRIERNAGCVAHLEGLRHVGAVSAGHKEIRPLHGGFATGSVHLEGKTASRIALRDRALGPVHKPVLAVSANVTSEADANSLTGCAIRGVNSKMRSRSVTLRGDLRDDSDAPLPPGRRERESSPLGWFDPRRGPEGARSRTRAPQHGGPARPRSHRPTPLVHTGGHPDCCGRSQWSVFLRAPRDPLSVYHFM